MKKQARIVVSGRVQGVSFRAYTQRMARIAGLLGYVRNLPNGDVEIVAEGEEDRLHMLIDWARTGPPMAAVENVQVEYVPSTDGFQDFMIQH